jgi:Uma2 family endonuclease
MASEMASMPFEAVRDGSARGEAIVLRLPAKKDVYSNEEFWELCKLNPDLRMEQNRDGSVVIMNPVVSDGGRQELNVSAQLWIWAKQNGQGIAFGPSAGFTLPTTPAASVRAPAASWIPSDRWNALGEADQNQFASIVPDFVAELRSPSDTMRELREKMREYIEVGVQLGWLIDPTTRSVEIYRPGKEVERIENATMVSGDPELKGFVLDLGKVW